MKKKKKSKILIFCSSVLTLLLCAFVFSIKTKAVEDFSPNALVEVYSQNQNNYLAKLVGYITNGNITQSDINDTFTISNQAIVPSSLGVYVVEADIDIDNYVLVIWRETTLNDYITTYYNQGYNDGTEANNDVVYNEGYKEGMKAGKIVGSSEGYQKGYNEGYDYGHDVGYASGLNAQMPNVQLSILSLLGTIFMFPFKLIALGFDVDIFGINVGELMVFILWTSLILGIVAVLKKGVIK